MKFINWANSKIKKLEWTDIMRIKLSVMAFTLMVAKLWNSILNLDWYWYALLFLLFAIRPAYKVFKK